MGHNINIDSMRLEIYKCIEQICCQNTENAYLELILIAEKKMCLLQIQVKVVLINHRYLKLGNLIWKYCGFEPGT